MPTQTPSSQLSYKGETCDVCGALATRIVHYDGDTIALCGKCKAQSLYL